MTLSADNDILKIKNPRGKPTIYKKITAQYKSSSGASIRTIRRRSQQMNAYRKLLGGNSKTDIKVQSLSDFRRQPKNVQSDIIKKMDVKVEIDAASTVALQQYVNLSGEQLAKVKRFHKEEFKVEYASKGKCKDFSKKIVEGKVDVTPISETTVTANGKKQKIHRLGHVPALDKFVINLVDTLDKHGKLTWHGESGIPEDEIWVKLGGDHGKGSMKICVQIANVEKPNARENTHVVAWVYAKDTHDILKEMCIYLNPELKKLKGKTWNGKRFRIFLFGDYLFLCAIYGLSGQAGKFPCLWCNIELGDMRAGAEITPGALNDRTLSSIKDQYSKFKESGSIMKNAKEFSNCVRPVLLEIDIENVVPMYLHVNLGITVKHHELLKIETHKLDAMLAEQFAKDKQYRQTGCTQFDKYVDEKRELTQLVTERQRIADALTGYTIPKKERSAYKAKLLEFDANIEDVKEKLKGKHLTPGVGPLVNSIEGFLADHGIQPQAYHGGTFNGNHSHKYMNEKVFTDITDRICAKTEKLSKHKEIIQAAGKLKDKFDKINRAYSRIHIKISHTKPIDQETQDQIQSDIDSYIKLYKTSFPDQNVLPKMHILQDHCVNFIRSTGFGLGLLGEQGGELLHCTLSKFEQRAQGIRNDKKRMRSQLEAHHLSNSPTVREKFPQIKSRKLSKNKI